MEIKSFGYNSPEYGKALKLRYEILRLPLGLQFTEEELKKDVSGLHFGLFDGDNIIACLILSPSGTGEMKMRQVATAQNYQGKGLGKRLAKEAERYAIENGFEKMFCHARKTAVPFYQSMGYNITGAEFTEVNIPHYKMEKKLKYE